MDLATVIQVSKLVWEDSPYKLALLPQCQYLACMSITGGDTHVILYNHLHPDKQWIAIWL